MIDQPSTRNFVISMGHNSYIVELEAPPESGATSSFINAIVYEESYGMKSRREVYRCLADKYTTPEKSAKGVLLTWLRSLHYHGSNVAKVLTDLERE